VVEQPAVLKVGVIRPIATDVTRNAPFANLPGVAVGAIAAVGVIAMFAGMATGTGKAKISTNPGSSFPGKPPKGGATKPAATAKKTAGSTAADSATGADPGAADPADVAGTPEVADPVAPVAIADPKPPQSPALTCDLKPSEASKSSAGGGVPDADIGALFVSGTEPNEIVNAAQGSAWAQGRRVTARSEPTADGPIIHVTVPPDFNPTDFAVAEMWFRALPGFKDYERGDQPSTAVIGCLNGVADPDQLVKVLLQLAEAKKIDGYSISTSGDAARIELTRGTVPREWTALSATFASLGTVASWTVFDVWPTA
jgi:hypothetical protein